MSVTLLRKPRSELSSSPFALLACHISCLVSSVLFVLVSNRKFGIGMRRLCLVSD